MSDTEKKIIIAVDGFSSCGKSTFAKAIAARLGYIFIDTGALYRAVTLYALGFIEDFGDDYMRRHAGDTIDVRTFTITDADYADFAEFMKDKKVPYESDTRRALKALKKAAEEDRFEELAAKFERVESELKDDTQTNLETYRREVVEAINNDIILRHAYTAGVIEHSLTDDAELQQAVGVLQSPDEYRRITTEQDTRRK